MSVLSLDTLRPLKAGDNIIGKFHALAALEDAGLGTISRMPMSLRVILESMLRNQDGDQVGREHIEQLASWQPRAERTREIPFIVARIVAPDASGIPLLADLAAMREVAARMGHDAEVIEPQIPVDLIIDHSLEVERAGTPDALAYNMRQEFSRNEERYSFLKWAAGAFKAFSLIPPGVGIIHQINIEKLARGVWEKDGIYFPDSLIGTDSHTSMINGIGVLGWGVGGIEAEAAMLGQPVYFLTPDVVGVELDGRLNAGVTSTDMVLTVVQILRRANVVGKFVEFFGSGAAALSATDRCTISNMAPEYGATAAYFPVDNETVDYMAAAGRTAAELEALRAYYQAQSMFGMPLRGEIDYSEEVRIDLAGIVPCVAGPSRPQDRIDLSGLKSSVNRLISLPKSEGGFGVAPPVARAGGDSPRAAADLAHNDIVIAAITSCSNTSNPGVLLAAGLLAKKAVQAGLQVNPRVKTSFTPGSRVVQAYMAETGLQTYLDQLGFHIVGYGCATCMGNSGPLDPLIEQTINDNNLVVASVLSGNRNFEARIHQAVKANYLMSPPLVVAFAIAGRIDFDPISEPLGYGHGNQAVYLRDIWPAPEEIEPLMKSARDPAHFLRLYAGYTEGDELWKKLQAPAGQLFAWEAQSSYLRCPPFFDDFSLAVPALAPLRAARALAILGDSVTTDHVSPGSTINAKSPAGMYLRGLGLPAAEFNSYIARRANHEVMMRGTFGNVRLRNFMTPGIEGGVTAHQPGGETMSIYDAAMAYRDEQVPLVVIAGKEYGTGSSRDWAAKGPSLLGVRAIIAGSFERIHRSNLVGMGILPCQFIEDSVESLGLTGRETFDIAGMEHGIEPRSEMTLRIHRENGAVHEARVLVRIDTPIEANYYRHGGILPYILRTMLEKASKGVNVDA